MKKQLIVTVTKNGVIEHDGVNIISYKRYERPQKELVNLPNKILQKPRLTTF
jgi:hypothetical protein